MGVVTFVGEVFGAFSNDSSKIFLRVPSWWRHMSSDAAFLHATSARYALDDELVRRIKCSLCYRTWPESCTRAMHEDEAIAPATINAHCAEHTLFLGMHSVSLHGETARQARLPLPSG